MSNPKPKETICPVCGSEYTSVRCYYHDCRLKGPKPVQPTGQSDQTTCPVCNKYRFDRVIYCHGCRSATVVGLRQPLSTPTPGS